MVSDTVYSSCLPILEDASLEEEDVIERLEELVEKEASLSGKSLENAVLDILWRFRESKKPSTATPPTRHIVIRKSSPAPWQQLSRSSTPLPTSPTSAMGILPPPGLGMTPPVFALSRSSAAASPFGSPRPSPALAFSMPRLPYSPSLSHQDFANDVPPSLNSFGEYGSDNVDWLVRDESLSTPSSLGAGNGFSSMQNAGFAPPQTDMSPYDILRSVLGEDRSDADIEKALESCGYDFNATLISLMDPQGDKSLLAESVPSVTVGKSISSNSLIDSRPSTPSQARNGTICKFFLSNGTCLRADCRFSHDLGSTICKYWMMGNCLAGDTCIFAHGPSNFSNLNLDESPASTPPKTSYLGSQDTASFPPLNPAADAWPPTNPYSAAYKGPGSADSSSLRHNYLADHSNRYKPHSRPSSRHQLRENTSAVPSVDDTEAFPSLGASISKTGHKKHHGKRGHGHAHKEAKDIVRMSPSPNPSQQGKENIRLGGISLLSRRQSGLSMQSNTSINANTNSNIPPPKHIPWLESADRANKQYLHARASAIKHGALRNKLLQSAQQAWTRNDARAAKALSLRGQSENDLMRKAYREAARYLEESRKKILTADTVDDDTEVYLDLHGLSPEDAVARLDKTLLEHGEPSFPKQKAILYIITGSSIHSVTTSTNSHAKSHQHSNSNGQSSHHAKNGASGSANPTASAEKEREKISRSVKTWLEHWRYEYSDFCSNGESKNLAASAGIIGVDGRTWDSSVGPRGQDGPDEEVVKEGVKKGKSEEKLVDA
jgi:hypothetical protein